MKWCLWRCWAAMKLLHCALTNEPRLELQWWPVWKRRPKCMISSKQWIHYYLYVMILDTWKLRLDNKHIKWRNRQFILKTEPNQQPNCVYAHIQNIRAQLDTDLKSCVHLKEVKVLLRVNKEFHSPSRGILHSLSQLHCLLAHRPPRHRVKESTAEDVTSDAQSSLSGAHSERKGNKFNSLRFNKPVLFLNTEQKVPI